MGELFLLRNSLRDLLRPKTLALAGGMVALPALTVMLMKATQGGTFEPETAYNIVSGLLIFGFLLVMLCVVFGSGVITAETEGKTIVYLLTRPVPRWRIALVKFTAACGAVLLTVWLSTLLLGLTAYGPGGLGKSPLGRDMTILPVGVLAYGALALLLGALFTRPLIVGLLYAFFWESWVPNLPGEFEKLSVMAYLRALAPHPEPEAETRGIAELLKSAASSTITPTMAWWVLSLVIVIGLGLALLLFSTREYVPRDDTAA
jgi:ABC-2 type transport system permease protein